MLHQKGMKIRNHINCERSYEIFFCSFELLAEVQRTGETGLRDGVIEIRCPRISRRSRKDRQTVFYKKRNDCFLSCGYK
jgi:hypothetical protein